MAVVLALTAAGALLVVGSGLAKLVRPSGAASALRAVGLPGNALLVRTGSLVELVVGVAVLSSASWVPRLALALVYGALAAFVAVSLRAGSHAGCGCFGDRDAPMSARHLAFSGAFAIAALASLLGPARADRLVAGEPAAAAAVVLLLAVATAALSAVLMARPRGAA